MNQDELDAANKVVKSKAEIRQVLIDFETENSSKLFGNAAVTAAKIGPVATSETEYEDVDTNGTPVLMNIGNSQSIQN